MCDIIKPKHFNPELVSFTDVKTNKFGGRSVFVNYSDAPLRIQTPKMHLPYDLNEDDLRDSNETVIGKKYATNLSFRGKDRADDESATPAVRSNAKKLNEFHKMLQALENRIIEEGVSKSGSWLQQKGAEKAVVKALFNSSIKVSKDKETGMPNGKYPDTIRGKIMFWDGAFSTEVYSKERELVDLRENLVKGAQVTCLLESSGMWFIGGKFGMSWRIKQVQVYSAPAASRGGFMMLPDSDDEEEDEISLAPSAVASSASSASSASASVAPVASSSEDESVEEASGSADVDEGVVSSSEEEEEEEEPPPPPKKVKKPKKPKNA